MKKLLKELREAAQELLDAGDSHCFAEGRGMFAVIEAIEEKLNHETGRKKETEGTGSGKTGGK